VARDFRNEFSWSFTRHKIFHECRRQYYHNYYGYWNGWSEGAPERARLTYRLKKMQSFPMWLGDVVHRMIERILGDLRNRELNSIERYQRQARDILNREWKQSIDKKWMWKPKYNLNLFEHYYDGPEPTADDRVAGRDKVYDCLEHFMESDVFADLAALRPQQWKSVEKLDQFPIGDHPAFAKIDCAVVTADGALTIYDWKTGKQTETTATQLGCYALYAFHTWHTPAEQQRLVCYYLHPDVVESHTPTPQEMIETKDFALGSMAEMIDSLDSSADENRADEERFAMASRRTTCRRCFFREVCFDTLEWTEEMEGG